MEVAALEGAHASVIGGAPAAAVVFTREVDGRTRRDPRVVELEQAIADPERADKALPARPARRDAARPCAPRSWARWPTSSTASTASSARCEVGSIHHIIPPERLRPYLIEAVERGMARELAER